MALMAEILPSPISFFLGGLMILLFLAMAKYTKNRWPVADLGGLVTYVVG